MNCGQLERRMVNREGQVEWTFAPRTDIKEMDDHFAIEVELPGVSSEQVDLQVEGDELRLTATRNGKTDGEYLTRERVAGRFTRVFRLGETVDLEGIRGEMVDGILRIHIPKAARVLPRKITINV
jgi:HSP20 family protein